MRGSASETCLLIESVDFGNLSQKKLMRGCALVAQQKTKVETKNDWLAIDGFRLPHPVVETK